jgi:hypothetical protein
LAAALGLSLAAQPVAGQEVTLRTVLQLGAADLRGADTDSRWGNRAVVGGGLGATLRLPLSVTVELETLFAGKGTRFRDEDELFEQRSRYLEIPVGVFANPRIAGPMGGRVGGGGALALLTSCEIAVGIRLLQTAPGPEQWSTTTQDCNNGVLRYDTRTLDWSAFGEAGVWVHWARYTVSLAARLERGVTSIAPSQDDLDIKTQVISCRATVDMRL